MNINSTCDSNKSKASQKAFCLSDEQQHFVEMAKQGHNILVDACIGSGKTTAIQFLCDQLPESKKILYLTYNRLLKVDARNKIKNKNVLVTNYHGFAGMYAHRNAIKTSVSDVIKKFNQSNFQLDHYDIMIIDEYQDIEQEFADMLIYIKSYNPQMQIVAVGDMEQKIYDKTVLNVSRFIQELLGDYVQMSFSVCFRLSSQHADKLGKIWGKKIIGVNDNCAVEEMGIDEVISFLSKQDTKDILCLGKRKGKLSDVLNILETQYSEKFNKKTVYASIRDEDSGSIDPNKKSAIFTTYDSSKGMERRICVIFDYTEEYWDARAKQPMQSYEILRNIFCVAASRGKEKIIFVRALDTPLSDSKISTRFETNTQLERVDISSMFDFKYREDIEKCYSLLKVQPVLTKNLAKEINVSTSDELIDLSPCVGTYQEAVYFNKYNIDLEIEMQLSEDKGKFSEELSSMTLDEKILLLASMETKQDRYRTQVQCPFVNERQKQELIGRLSSVFGKNETVQVDCNLIFKNSKDDIQFTARGRADVIKENVVYELKYVTALKSEHFLQCACYVIALGLQKGILWNTRDNSMLEITVPDKKAFLDAVVTTVTMHQLSEYHGPSVLAKSAKLVVIDTETNYEDEVISIGAVLADCETLSPIEKRYYILNPEAQSPAMYSRSLRLKGCEVTRECHRSTALHELRVWMKKNDIYGVFAYNANFDRKHLPELLEFAWYDIMRIAPYRQYNKKIPPTAICNKTGRLKKYGVEAVMKIMSGNDNYQETHNALFDAMDELEIMRGTGQHIDIYNFACISPQKNQQGSCFVVQTKNVPPPPKDGFSKKANYIESQTNRDNQGDTSEKAANLNDCSSEKLSSEINPPFVENSSGTQKDYYVVSDVCERLNVSKNYVYDLIHSGELKATKEKNRYIILKSDFEQYLERYLKGIEETRKRLMRFLILVSVAVMVAVALRTINMLGF